MSEHLNHARRYHEAIRDVLLHEWDPIGVSDEPDAQDEYDSYVGRIQGMLTRHEPRHAIVEHLWNIETHLMGLTGNLRHTEAIADRLLAVRDQFESNLGGDQ